MDPPEGVYMTSRLKPIQMPKPLNPESSKSQSFQKRRTCIPSKGMYLTSPLTTVRGFSSPTSISSTYRLSASGCFFTLTILPTLKRRGISGSRFHDQELRFLKWGHGFRYVVFQSSNFVTYRQYASLTCKYVRVLVPWKSPLASASGCFLSHSRPLPALEAKQDSEMVAQTTINSCNFRAPLKLQVHDFF
jgi:hypothetical protein